ncbi:MAG: hypothetical protein JW929_14125 [Anaerolineales bacterium]|nr:hypothetical protein [Anaerolineales bacterium]
MRRMILAAALLLGLACNAARLTAPAASTDTKENPAETACGEPSGTPVAAVPESAEVVPVPSTAIQIEGVPYSAYQFPGDPFRIVCQEPCPLDLQAIYAEYAGFRVGHAALVELLGIDTLPELQPVDMHLLLDDSVCDELPVGHASVYYTEHRAYTCSQGPGFYPTDEEWTRMASRPDKQYFPLHEYMHTVFFGRISGRAGDFFDYRAEWFHDYVVPIPSYAIGILNLAEFTTRRDPNPPGDYGGWLINELCRRNGFRPEHLALSLVELDALYRSGGGLVSQEGYDHPAPTVSQYRDILNRLLGGDTTGAFAAACWPPELFGNSYAPLPECARPTEEILGTATSVS